MVALRRATAMLGLDQLAAVVGLDRLVLPTIVLMLGAYLDRAMVVLIQSRKCFLWKISSDNLLCWKASC